MKLKKNIPWMTNERYIEMPEGADVCRIDRQTYFEQFEGMPPLCVGAQWFACSEPYDHIEENGRYVPTFSTYCFETDEDNNIQYFFLGHFSKQQLRDIRQIIQDRIAA